MLTKYAVAIVALFALVEPLAAQNRAASSGDRRPLGWRDAGRTDSAARRSVAAAVNDGDHGETVPDAIEPLRAIGSQPRRSLAQVKQTAAELPNRDGQVWREYDISPYTLRVTSTNNPQQAIVDWILRETGYETWHSGVVALLSADRRTLRVYHTPEMQAVVGEVVDRFVNSEAETYAFGVRVVSVGSPTWRARARRLMQPVAVQSQGIQAWLLAKEDAALMMAELRRRSDFREHSSPHLLVNNGQSTVVSTTRARPYVRDVILNSAAWPGFESESGQIDEGFSLELSPLLSLEGDMIDAVLKCHIDQVEKMVPVMLEVPTAQAPRQRAKVEVPQISQTRLHERFRWPADHVLCVGLGMVATPVPTTPSAFRLGFSLTSSAPRADLLIFVENKGKLGGAPSVTRTGDRNSSGRYRGRY